MTSTQIVLTNAGTVNWLGALNINVLKNDSTIDGSIETCGRELEHPTDQLLNQQGNNTAFFNNAGTITKSVTANETDFNIILNNSGEDLQTGFLYFFNGGTIGGEFDAPPGDEAVMGFNAGDWIGADAVVNAAAFGGVCW